MNEAECHGLAARASPETLCLLRHHSTIDRPWRAREQREQHERAEHTIRRPRSEPPSCSAIRMISCGERPGVRIFGARRRGGCLAASRCGQADDCSVRGPVTLICPLHLHDNADNALTGFSPSDRVVKFSNRLQRTEWEMAV